MQLYNTLTKQKEPFDKAQDERVNMFVCGPTVYDYPHIGHARTYIVFDVITKYLRSVGYDVFYLQNITDIDERIIARAERDQRSWQSVADEFTLTYEEDIRAIGVNSVSQYAQATKHIPEIIKQVKTLIDRGYAYLIEDEGYYFDLSKFPDYGKLSGRTVEEAEDSTSRIDESIKKKNKGDFVLWRLSEVGHPSWNFHTGEYLGLNDGSPAFAEAMAGKPGWHIEDTAISEKYLGPQYDIHGGARDLIFPHHEAEIAQQESASGKVPFVKYWLHTGFVVTTGRKMSKSLGNFVTIREILTNYTPEALRFLSLASHYRSPIDYGEEKIKASEAAIQRLSEFQHKLQNVVTSETNVSDHSPKDLLANIDQKFKAAMEDDFNTADAIGAIFNLAKELNPLIDGGKISAETAEQVLRFLDRTNKILGIIPLSIAAIPHEVQSVVKLREELRQDKDFAGADKLREQIEAAGYHIEDTLYGPLVKKKG